MKIVWNPEKDALLKTRYGFGFERAVVAFGDGALIADRLDPNQDRYPNQRQFSVTLDGYVWIVPYVEDADRMFLKTMFPSRKATRDCLRGRQ